MLIRFETSCHNNDGDLITGIFWVTQYLYHAGQFASSQAEEDRVWEILDWYDKNLTVPTKLAKSSKKTAEKKALSWFKDSAKEHVAMMWELTNILKRYDVPVRVLTTSSPGYVTYEDEVQIVAEPFKT